MLNEKQLKSIEMLVEGETKVKIAKDLGIERKTIYRWLDNNNEYITQLDKRTHDFKTSVQKDANRKLLNMTNYAIDELVKMSKDSENVEAKRKILFEILDRTLGKVSNNVDISVAEPTESIGNAKDLLKKYNKQLADISEDIEEE